MKRDDELYDPILVLARWLVSAEHCSSCKHVLALAAAASTLGHTRGVPILLLVLLPSLAWSDC